MRQHVSTNHGHLHTPSSTIKSGNIAIELTHFNAVVIFPLFMILEEFKMSVVG
jgi:hypothetical protein